MYRYIRIVLAHPNITQQPLSTLVRAGDKNRLIMRCKADGIGSIVYKWEMYHLSSNSWIRPSHRTEKTTSSYLIYHVVKEEDEGIYRCVISNGYDSVVSDNATLTVYGKCSV